MLKKSLTALAVAPLLTLAACGGSGSGKAETGADGVTMGPGVTDDEISVTVISDFSGPIAQGGIAYSLGVEAKIDQVNREEGGVCGRKVVVDKRDTKYDPQITTQQYRAAAPDNLMVAQFVGTAGLNAVRTSIERDNMPTLSASINTQTLDLPNVYVAMPPFEVELINGLVWAAEEVGASATKTVKVGFVTSADETGKVYLDALNHAAKAIEGVEVVAEPTYTNADKDFTAQINSLKGAGAEIVMLGVTPPRPWHHRPVGPVRLQADLRVQLGCLVRQPREAAEGPAGQLLRLRRLRHPQRRQQQHPGADQGPRGLRSRREAGQLRGRRLDQRDRRRGGAAQGVRGQALTREGVKKAMVDLEVPFDDILPPINLGDGNSIVSYQSRINKIGADGVQEPVAKFFESAAAKSWGETRGN